LNFVNSQKFFSGTYPVVMDAQRRLTIPKSWRFLGNDEPIQFFLLPGRNHRLELVTSERIEEIMKKILGVSVANGESMDSFTDIGSKIQVVEMDKQGRFSLNPVLMEYAQIKDKAVFLGSLICGTIVSAENCEIKSAPQSSSLDILQHLEEKQSFGVEGIK